MTETKKQALLQQLGRNAVYRSPVPVSQSAGQLSRRQAIALLVGTGAAILSRTSEIKLHPKETLLLCSSNVPLCWTLYFEGGLVEAHSYIMTYLSQLIPLIGYSAYKMQAAALASQGHQLAGLIEILFHNHGMALRHTKQSVELAKLTNDPALIAAAYIRQSVALSNLHQSASHRLNVMNEALTTSKSVSSPLLKARVYAGLAEIYSALDNESTARSNLDLMHKYMPVTYEDDPDPETHFDAWSLHMYEKDVYLNLQKPTDAWNTLELSHKLVETRHTVNRVDLTLKQAEVSILLDDLTRGRTYLLDAVDGATEMRSQSLLENAYDLYCKMKQKWPKEATILELKEQMERNWF